MALYEGERIKIFPDTDFNQYCRFIHSQGFTYKKVGEYLIILKKAYPKYDRKTFSKIFTHRRKLKKLSREEVAEKVGVTEYTVFTWEIGRFMPSKYNLDKIMPVLDITERDMEKCQI